MKKHLVMILGMSFALSMVFGMICAALFKPQIPETKNQSSETCNQKPETLKKSTASGVRFEDSGISHPGVAPVLRQGWIWESWCAS